MDSAGSYRATKHETIVQSAAASTFRLPIELLEMVLMKAILILEESDWVAHFGDAYVIVTSVSATWRSVVTRRRWFKRTLAAQLAKLLQLRLEKLGAIKIHPVADFPLSCRVQGIATLHSRVYVVIGSDVIRVYDAALLQLLDEIVVSHEGTAMWAMNIASSSFSNCLYAFDSLNSSIWQVNQDNGTGYQWLDLAAKQCADSLCVTSKGKVALISDESKLDVYGPDARLELTIRVASDVTQLRHAIETPSGNFVIVHGGGTSESPCKISEISMGGCLIRSFDDSRGSKAIPFGLCQLARGDDCIYVVDFSNYKLFVLDSKLSVSRVLVEFNAANQNRPLRILHMPESDRLYVGVLEEEHGYRGKVLQYSLCSKQ